MSRKFRQKRKGVTQKTRGPVSSLPTWSTKCKFKKDLSKKNTPDVEVIIESPEEISLRNDILDTVLSPSWSKSPAWRWDIVTSFVANPTKLLRRYKADCTIIKGVNFYRSRYIDRASPEKWRKKFPAISTAVDIYLQNQAEGIRWALEALLMAPLTDKEIVNYLKLNISIEAIQYYRLLFFDIAEYRESPIAILSNVLAISKLNIKDKVASDLLWKWFVYTHGPDEFMLELPGSENKGSQKFKKWSQELLKKNMFINACVLSTDIRQANTESAIGVLNTAKAYMDIDSEASTSIEETAVGEMLSAIHKSIDIELMSSDIQQGAVEKF